MGFLHIVSRWIAAPSADLRQGGGRGDRKTRLLAEPLEPKTLPGGLLALLTPWQLAADEAVFEARTATRSHPDRETDSDGTWAYIDQSERRRELRQEAASRHTATLAADTPRLVRAAYVSTTLFDESELARRRGRLQDALTPDIAGEIFGGDVAALFFAGNRFEERQGEGSRRASHSSTPTQTSPGQEAFWRNEARRERRHDRRDHAHENESADPGDFNPPVATLENPPPPPPPPPPNAVDDAAYTAVDQTITLNVMLNDTGGGTITSVTQPADGTVVIGSSGTYLTYTGDAGVDSGVDTFQYTVTNFGGSDTATVTMTYVEVSGYSVEWKRPDNVWEAIPSGDNLWVDDELRWTAQFSPSNPPNPGGVLWVAKPWADVNNPSVPWTTFAQASGSAAAYGNPGLGVWAITPRLIYGGFTNQSSFVAQMEDPKREVDAKITSIEWATHTSDPDEAGELTPALRFYPDATAAGGSLRSKVDVIVTVAPAVAGVKLHLKAYDVDDPTSNVFPVDDDSGEQGTNADNRSHAATHHELTPASGTTDGGGVLRAVFDIHAVQPGNNWRIAAAKRDLFLTLRKPLSDDTNMRLFLDWNNNDLWEFSSGEITLDHTNGSDSIRVTPTLTLWRYLHVEVDSMGIVSGNTTSVNVASVDDLSNGKSEVALSAALSTGDNNRFEKGKVTDSAGNIFEVVENSTMVVTVKNLANGTVPALGAATLVDDDGLVDGEDVPMPDYSKLDEAMGFAFVTALVTEDDDDVTFDLHAPDSESLSDTEERTQLIASLASWNNSEHNSEAFWVAYVLGAFQGMREFDNDPFPDQSNTGVSSNGEGGSLIYLETIRDLALGAAGAGFSHVTVEKVERETVVHEVGHAVGRSGDHPVTEWENIEQDDKPLYRYTEEYLALIRSAAKPESLNTPP